METTKGSDSGKTQRKIAITTIEVKKKLYESNKACLTDLSGFTL